MHAASGYHYPPELMNLLIDAIPRLFKSKTDVLLFFRGAGVANTMLADLAAKVEADRGSILKAEIARTVLTRLNEGGDGTLRERREVLKRVYEFEDFSTCWDRDRLEATGLVAQIRRVVNVKDSFTRMRDEREEESRKRRAEREAKIQAEQEQREKIGRIRSDLFAQFSAADEHARGKALESVLNRLFAVSGMQVREAFVLRGEEGQGVVEQVDGVIALDGEVYLVEMKWWTERLGPGDVAQHLVRVHNRGQARGIFISASGYTDAAVRECRESLSRCVFALCDIEEIVSLLDREGDLTDFLRRKIQVAIIDRNPYHRILE